MYTQHKYLIVLLLFSLKFFIGSSTRDPYLRDLENQIAKKEERKRREQTDHMPEWWEKNPQPQVQIPSRPHPSQVTNITNFFENSNFMNLCIFYQFQFQSISRKFS